MTLSGINVRQHDQRRYFFEESDDIVGCCLKNGEIAEVPHACERDRDSPQSWGWSRGRARVEFAHDVTHLYTPQASINHIYHFF
jgi:hypothetical protein